MKRISLLALGACAIILASCSSTTNASGSNASTSKDAESSQASASESTSNRDSFTLSVTDIDGELNEYRIEFDENQSLYSAIKDSGIGIAATENADGTHYIQSIAGSIIDSNWYLELSVNGEYSQVGADKINPKKNDQISFKSTCWNTVESGYGTMDNTDVLLDKTLYGFYKECKSLYMADSEGNTPYFDYYLAMSIGALNQNGYSIDPEDFLSEAYIDSFNTLNLNDTDDNKTQMSYLAKQYYYYKCFDLDTAILKREIANEKFDVLTDQYTDTANAFYYSAVSALDAKNANYDKFTTYFNNYEIALGDSACMCIGALNIAGLTDERKASFISTQTPAFTKNGVDAYGYGASASSTAQQIIAFSTIGEDIRDSKYEVEGVDMVEALLNNFTENYTIVSSYTGEEDLQFDTPQAIAALTSYKLFRDLGKSVNIYA